MSTEGRYRTGSHWGTTIIRSGDAGPDAEGRRADDRLVAVVVNEDHALAQRIVDHLNMFPTEGE